MTEWTWDPTLYAGSATYYAEGRVAYPAAVAEVLTVELGLDGNGRLLDVGCGPGSLTLLLAGRFASAVGVDADAGMVAEAARRAETAGVTNVSWVHRRAEELPAGLGTFRVATFAQSFHWMDRPRVAAIVHDMVEPGGALVHVHATTHQGVGEDEPVERAQPPWVAVTELVRRYLGPVRRAGQGTIAGDTPSGETEIYRAAGFAAPRRLEVPGAVVTRTVDQVVAAVFSLSSSTPHLFGDRRDAFEADLRALLADAAPDGLFAERIRDIALDVFRR